MLSKAEFIEGAEEVLSFRFQIQDQIRVGLVQKFVHLAYIFGKKLIFLNPYF